MTLSLSMVKSIVTPLFRGTIFTNSENSIFFTLDQKRNFPTARYLQNKAHCSALCREQNHMGNCYAPMVNA